MDSARREALVLALAQALHASGAPAHRLEETLGRLTAHLDLEAQFFSTPTCGTQNAALPLPFGAQSGLNWPPSA